MRVRVSYLSYLYSTARQELTTGTVCRAPEEWATGTVSRAPKEWATGTVCRAPEEWATDTVCRAPEGWATGTVCRAPEERATWYRNCLQGTWAVKSHKFFSLWFPYTFLGPHCLKYRIFSENAYFLLHLTVEGGEGALPICLLYCTVFAWVFLIRSVGSVSFWAFRIQRYGSGSFFSTVLDFFMTFYL